jgi:ribosome-binding protein aMBF1 (putative translation factor)
MTERSAEGGIQPALARAGKRREPIGQRPSRRGSPSQRARKTDDLDLLIGKRLRERRMLLTITQEDLARQIGLSFQQLQKYEVGENRISAARLFKLSQILAVPITWFFQPFIGRREP